MITGYPTPTMNTGSTHPGAGGSISPGQIYKLAAEIEGGTWSTRKKSRHTTGSGFHLDCEKYNTATLDGWRVLQVRFSKMINDMTAIRLLAGLFKS